MNPASSAVPPSANFDFLEAYEPVLVHTAVLAEHYFADDPVTSLMKLRQFGELLAQQAAARAALYSSTNESQIDLLRRLQFEAGYPRDVIDLFHDLRRVGNEAAHQHRGDHAKALACLKLARQLAIWFHRTFGRADFKPGPFQPPRPPLDATVALRDELARLRSEQEATASAAERARIDAEQAQAARLSAEDQARAAAEERSFWEQYAAEAEAQSASLAAELARVQAAAAAASPATQVRLKDAADRAATGIDLDEAATRAIIDARLRARGWDTDTESLRYALGTRPAKNRNLAIAEWPTTSGPADYALFVGTTCVGVVEAKRQRKNVSAAIDQATRYAQGFRAEAGVTLPNGSPWAAHSGSSSEPPYYVPLLFATNGRPYLKQIETQSGIWFRDARIPTNQRRALVDWPTPGGLLAQLGLDRLEAQVALQGLPIDFAFPLRPYQKAAIESVEATIADDGKRSMLVAMATGTGKTRLAIALLYRLLQTKRFRRICFVVDRNALGEQAAVEFKTTRIVSTRTFADIFGLKELADAAVDLDTAVHICTIQGLVQRVLYASEPEASPPVDQYDLMVVDECHRGYLLDRELSDTELVFRNEVDYVSKYRRVLEYFDAVKIGLTATPALHTTQIFGDPIFTYSYREAVIDGWLIDSEPPVNIKTELSHAGIHFRRGDELPLLDPVTGTIDLTHAPDDLDFEIDDFNRRVVTREFNRVVAEVLAEHIDPYLPGKTLVFATSDGHADIVVDELRKALAATYGGIDDSAIAKITGSIDRPTRMIRRFRNDALPTIAVTVDLLTTGVDVPSIVNVIFLRRVASRILYDQMLGRATRLCEEIGKETLRIFDAVGIYEVLKPLTAMKPVVVDPKISLAQLLLELVNIEDQAHRDLVRDQIIVKLRRRLRHLGEEVREQYERHAGETPEATLQRLDSDPLESLVDWVQSRPQLGPILDWDPVDGASVPLVVSTHSDSLRAVTSGYPDGKKPEDYLDGFGRFVRENQNRIAALQVVTQRPRDMTRADLKALALELDRLGFTAPALRRAWRETRNEDIAAGIVGFVRQAALGDPRDKCHEPQGQRSGRAQDHPRMRRRYTR
jgi:type I restriction enzyme R subunit